MHHSAFTSAPPIFKLYWSSSELDWENRQHRSFLHHVWYTLAHDLFFWLIAFVTLLPRAMSRLLAYVGEPTAEHLADVGSIVAQFAALLIIVALISRRINRGAHTERMDLLARQPELFSDARTIRKTLDDPAELRWSFKWALGGCLLAIVVLYVFTFLSGNKGFYAAFVVSAIWGLCNVRHLMRSNWDNEAFERALKKSPPPPPNESTLAQWRLS